MIKLEEITTKHLKDLEKEIERDMSAKGMNNTKSALNSLEVRGNALWGNDYIYFLDKGRRPGKFPPVDIMIDWVRSKLEVPEDEEDAVAYLVGRKIRDEGTNIFKDKSKGIQLDNKVNNMLNNLYEELGNEAKAEALKWL